MKLERSNSIRDAQAVTPVTRRISLSVVSPHPPLGPLATEPMEDQMNQNQVTEKYHFHFESNEVESVDDDDEIQEAKTIDSVNREDSTELVVGDVIGIQALPELPGPEKLLQRRTVGPHCAVLSFRGSVQVFLDGMPAQRFISSNRI